MHRAHREDLRRVGGSTAKASPTCSSRTTTRIPGDCMALPTTERVHEGRVPPISDQREAGGESGATRNQGRGALRADDRSGARPHGSSPAERPATRPCRHPFGRRFDETVDDVAPRPTNSTRRSIPATLSEDAHALRGRRSRGCSGRSSSITTSSRTGSTAIPGLPAPPGAPGRTQQPVDSLVQRGRHLDAGQMGVPVVCGVGPRIPLRSARARGLGLRQGAALLLLREWYMHPNGQLPAYEWAFGDVNPPVHAWAALRVYQIEETSGTGDLRVPRARIPEAAPEFHLVGEPQGCRRHERLPGRLPGPRQHRRVRSECAAADRRPPRQSDGTSWMAMYSLNMLAIATELAKANRATRTSPASSGSTSSTSHTPWAAAAARRAGSRPVGRRGWLLLRRAPHFRRTHAAAVRSLVGLIPLLAVQTLEPERLERHGRFYRRLDGS